MRAVSDRLRSSYTGSGLSWGWGDPEGQAPHVRRWAFTECGLYLQQPARVQISGYAPDEMVISALACGEVAGGPREVNGRFEL